jgi:anti-sigma factor NepR-like protein
MTISMRHSRGTEVRMHEPCVAIGRQLRADYSDLVAQPLPRRLAELTAQLVAFEGGRRGPDKGPAEHLSPAPAQLQLRSPSARNTSGDPGIKGTSS